MSVSGIENLVFGLFYPQAQMRIMEDEVEKRWTDEPYCDAGEPGSPPCLWVTWRLREKHEALAMPVNPE
jgi:hypothetical protein